VEEQPIRTVLDGDAEEVMKWPRSFIANSCCRAAMVWRRSSKLDVVRIISST
jgi:hypothetical protein